MKKNKDNMGKDNLDHNQEQTKSKGQLLKSARLEKGLTLELVHEETKIPMDALRAIEEGYTIRTLSKFYYNGFLKIYAKYLDIDVSKVIDSPPQLEMKQIVDDEGEKEFDIEQWIAKVFTRKNKQQMVIALGMLLSLFVLFKIITFFASGKKDQPKEVVPVALGDSAKKEGTPEQKQEPKTTSKEKEKSKTKETLTSLTQSRTTDGQRAAATGQTTTPATVASARTKTETQSQQNPSSVSNPQDASPSQGKKVTLTVRATKNSWLRVEVDGQVEFQSTLKLGSVETWFADKEIVISGRNISYLEFELNGKMIGKLGRKDRKVKKVTITKDGLQVSK